MEKWKKYQVPDLPLALQVTTHLELFLFAPHPPHPLGRPSLPGPSLGVLEPQSPGSGRLTTSCVLVLTLL